MMEQRSPSPVSPIETLSPRIQRHDSTLSHSSEAADALSPIARNADWVPSTFRWYFLLLPITTSLLYGTAILVMVWFSQQHYGLGTDDGSSIILFGWRFTPTLLAVIYTQMTVILFQDVQRTEPFARLANAPSGGATASGTVLYQSLSVFIDVTFKRKSLGKTSWCLVFAAFVNTLALLAISPLSSALLTSEEVIIPRTVAFSRMVPQDGVQLPLVANRETYFRTIAALMRNVSTSAWITDSSLTLPFWPSSEQVQLGPNIVSTADSWETETTALHADLLCQNMTLESAEMTPMSFSEAYGVGGKGPYNGTQPMVSFVLSSNDGCRYELSVHPGVDLAYNGGSTWSNASHYYFLSGQILYVGKIPFVANISSTSPYARLNTSPECRGRDIILTSTPWTKNIPGAIFENPAFLINQTYERSPNFRMRALICQSEYTMDQRTTKASINVIKHTTIEHTANRNNNSEAIPSSLLDVPSFQRLVLHNDWNAYFNRAGLRRDVEAAIGESHQLDSNSNRKAALPSFSGLGPLLAATYSYNISAMIDDPYLDVKAARIKGRFFTEVLHNALVDTNAVQSKSINGVITTIEERVMVVEKIGITLAVLFFTSLMLLFLVLWFSRLSHRPLNLQTDPSSAIGLSMLLNPQVAKVPTIKASHQTPSSQLLTTLRTTTFFTSESTLQEGNVANRSATEETPTKENKSNQKWQPVVIRLRMLFALASFLILVIVAILILNAFSIQSRLYQTAFVYEADLSKLGLSFSKFTPISIAPTVVSIAVGMWWSQLDVTLQILQPYISMSQGPTSISKGAGLTYQSKTWVGVAVKAARNRHFVLLMIAIGSVLCQVLTVSMSALFEKEATNIVRQVEVNRTLDIRQDPVITKILTLTVFADRQPLRNVWKVLNELYMDPPKNWLAGAAIQLSLNGSQLPWASDGWSFVPTSIEETINDDSKENLLYSANLTIKTAGLRARLECDAIADVANVSSWIVHPSQNGLVDVFDLEGFQKFYWLNGTMFDNSPSNTSTFANPNLIQCCSNGTSKTPERATIGYWSPTDPKSFPYVEKEWPVPFVIKWIVGNPVQISQKGLDLTSSTDERSKLLLFEKVPSLQAARCMPVIEMADAMVTLDQSTAAVLSFELIKPAQVASSAWSESFVNHDISGTSEHYTANYTGPLNITTSYGILFMDAMFKASDPSVDSKTRTYWEPSSDNAFVMRDRQHGLNMDLMTYSMFTLANKDPEALLNYSTLVGHANRTFQTFFQHFVNNGLSLTDGGLAFQSISDRRYESLGRPVHFNGTALPARRYAELNTNRTSEAWISIRVKALHMNAIATYLSVAILIWLVATTVVMACLQRRYTSSMVRDVHLIADVLVLIAGSENLLQLVHERDVSLERDEGIKTMLGWFKSKDDEIRWGVEIVGERSTVEWVDAPKQGWHVENKHTAKKKQKGSRKSSH